MSKPILCLDFDGVINSYKSGWFEAYFIPDSPVPGAFEFIHKALQEFDVQIFSSRSHQDGGKRAMITYMHYWAIRELTNDEPTWAANAVINAICYRSEAWPDVKPPAMVTIDDRAITFTGQWPDMETLKSFKPWNKK